MTNYPLLDTAKVSRSCESF